MPIYNFISLHITALYASLHQSTAVSRYAHRERMASPEHQGSKNARANRLCVQEIRCKQLLDTIFTRSDEILPFVARELRNPSHCSFQDRAWAYRGLVVSGKMRVSPGALIADFKCCRQMGQKESATTGPPTHKVHPSEWRHALRALRGGNWDCGSQDGTGNPRKGLDVFTSDQLYKP